MITHCAMRAAIVFVGWESLVYSHFLCRRVTFMSCVSNGFEIDFEVTCGDLTVLENKGIVIGVS